MRISVPYPATLTTALATSRIMQDPAKPRSYITLLLLLESRVTDLDLSRETVAELELDEIAHVWRLITTPYQAFVNSPNIGPMAQREVIDKLESADLFLGMELDEGLRTIIQLSLVPNNMKGPSLVDLLRQRLRTALVDMRYTSSILEAFLIGLDNPHAKYDRITGFTPEEGEAYRRGIHFANKV